MIDVDALELGSAAWEEIPLATGFTVECMV